MKSTIFCLFLLTGLICNTAYAQDIAPGTTGIPGVNIKSLDGSVVNSDVIANDGKPIILSFWATWCKPCVNELNTISEVYPDWKTETGVKVVIISIDDARSSSNVAPFVNGKGWEYETYLDPNGDFKRAMNVNMVPHTFLLNGKREVVDQHTSFALGDEEKLFEKVKKVAAGQPLH
jgi:cytochrome c biogenesis protein CcmG, thiol:disulfide interchange protein DsbE